MTGGQGFIGRRLVHKLNSKLDVETFVLTRSVSNTQLGTTKYIIGSIEDSETQSIIGDMNFDSIFHLAWGGLPDRNRELSEKNRLGSIKFLESVMSRSEPALNIMGSCLEYGETIGGVNENSPVLKSSDFAKAKIGLHEFLVQSKFRHKWFRPFYVYGPGQNSKSLIPTVVSAIKESKTLNLNSYDNSHDFIHVDDLVEAIALAGLDSSKFGDFNLGTGKTLTVGEIVNKAFELAEIDYSVEFNPKPGLYSNSRRMKEIYNFEPTHLGLEGLSKFLKTSF